MSSVQKWNTIFRQKENGQRGGRINSAMGMTSLSSCLAPTTDGSDKSPIKFFSNKRVPKNPSLSSHESFSNTTAIGMKEQRSILEGEELLRKLVEDKKLTDEQVCEIRRSFSSIDKNGDGSISIDELINAFEAIGHIPDYKIIKTLFQEADDNGDGIIDYKEFVSLMAISYENLHEDKYQREIYREAFNRFDVNKDGVIDSSDLKTLMDDIGNELRESEIFEMIQEADKNGDGVVDYEEFVQLFEPPTDYFS